MKRVLIVSGKKRSGKDTLCNFLTGYRLHQLGVIREFGTDDQGQLHVNHASHNADGQVEEYMAHLDLNRKDTEFLQYARGTIWPHIKKYSYAEYLKEVCMNLFGLTYDQCYGTTEDKNSLTKVKWDNLPGIYSDKVLMDQLARNKRKNKLEKYVQYRTGYMTAREVLQYFGTEVCRGFNEDCWVDYTCKHIIFDQADWSLISDGRFPNELTVMQGHLVPLEYEVRAVYLEREFEKADSHASESGLDKEAFDLVVPNQDMSIKEQNEFVVVEGLRKWGWV